MAKDLTRGPIGKNLFFLASPIFGMNLLFSLYSIVDMACVGRLGKEALAAVAIAITIFQLFGCLSGAYSRSVVRFVSQLIGAKQYEEARHAFTRSVIIAAGIGTAVAVTIYLGSRWMLNFMIKDDKVVALGVEYFTFIIPTFAYFMVNPIIAAALRADGDTKTALYINLFGNLLNAFLDIVLIFGYLGFPALGIAGAGLATLIARSLSFFVFVFLVFRGWGNIKLVFSGYAKLWNPADLKAFARHFGPGLAEGILRGLNGFIIMKLVTPFGAAAVAAYSVSARLGNYLYIPAYALSQAAASMVGQNIGAKKFDNAQKSYLTANALYAFIGLTGCAVLMICPGFFITLFIKDPEVIATGSVALRFFAVSVLFYGLLLSASYCLNASGNSVYPMVTVFLGNYCGQIPIAFFLSKYTSLGVMGVWIADPAAHVLHLAIYAPMIFTGRWLRKLRGR
jgi:putative MATE family efflux protein